MVILVSKRLALTSANVCHATHHSTAVEVGFEKPRVPFRFLKPIKKSQKVQILGIFVRFLGKKPKKSSQKSEFLFFLKFFFLICVTNLIQHDICK